MYMHMHMHTHTRTLHAHAHMNIRIHTHAHAHTHLFFRFGWGGKSVDVLKIFQEFEACEVVVMVVPSFRSEVSVSTTRACCSSFPCRSQPREVAVGAVCGNPHLAWWACTVSTIIYPHCLINSNIMVVLIGLSELG